MMKLFKSWSTIVAEHNELKEMMDNFHKIDNEHIKEWNSKRAPLMREEKKLREELVRSTEREKKEIEAKIGRIVDELKPLDTLLKEIAKKREEQRENIYSYMRENFTERELKKARKYGWEV